MKNLVTLGIVAVGGYLLYNYMLENDIVGTGTNAGTNTGTSTNTGTTTNGNVAANNNATQGNTGTVSTTPSLRDRLIATVTQAMGNANVQLNLDQWSYFYQVTANVEISPQQFDAALQGVTSREQLLTLDQFLTIWGNAGLGRLSGIGRMDIGIGQWLYANNPTWYS